MTPDDLAAIHARAEAATYYGGEMQELAEDTLALLAEAERLRDMNERLRAQHVAADEVIRAVLRALKRGPDTDPVLEAGRIVAERDALAAKIEQLRAAGPWTQHVEKMRAMKQERDGDCICDRNPETTDGPDEECPWHGRRYSEWIERGNVLAAKIARVEALATECEGQWGQCWNSIFGQRIRAALADPLAASEEQEEV